ncbi:MAG: serine hydrolase [Clostridia bacterium]|nr:serine hydrolase [Clostridia bacterium]
MKNPTPDQLSALRERARAIAGALPPLQRTADGRLTPESRRILAAHVQRVLRKNRAVGAALVLCSPGGADDVFCCGHARLSPRVPVTESTCFRLASVSKLVMTFGALSLSEAGMLDLDADISSLLGYPVRNPAAPDVPVTPRMLLTHTSSLCDEGNYGTRGMQPGCTVRELLIDPKNWLPQPPGNSFHYSNLGAGVMGVVMELAARQPFDDIMQACVFNPLSIRATYDPRRVSPADDLADGYAVRAFLPPHRKYDAAALSSAAPSASPFDPEHDFLIAAGRMITDSRGMARLIRLLASHGEMGVLSAKSLDLMRAPQDGIGGIAQAGRGLNVAFLPGVFPGASPVGHQGVAYGMCAELFADPGTGAGVGVMTSGIRLLRDTPPLMRAGFDLLALGFAAAGGSR